jgi:NADH dehydrogenase FAD-containing subunit
MCPAQKIDCNNPPGMPAFHYIDRGSLAVIGRNAAVIDLGFIRLRGFLAWLIWSFLHIYFLIGFDNRLVVFIQWAWSYLVVPEKISRYNQERGFREKKLR